MPTKNSAAHISIILDYYRNLRYNVNVFVDDSSSDNTFEIAKLYMPRVEYISNPGGRLETMIEKISSRITERWILRMDDDELPTREMLKSVEALCRKNLVHKQYAFRILHCMLNDSFGFSAVKKYEDPPHDQLRLYNKTAVSYDDNIHTPGIKISDKEIVSSSSYFIHLQWIVKSYRDRVAKIDHYDSQHINAGSAWRAYYLIEDDEEALATAYDLKCSDFSRSALKLSKCFPGSKRVKSRTIPVESR